MSSKSRKYGLCVALILLILPSVSAQLNAEIVASREECVAPCAIFFEGTNSKDANGYYIGDSTTIGDPNSRGLLGNDILEYTWDFGDGETFSGFNAAHVYEIPNNYTVRLTIRDVNGNNDSTTKNINVQTFSGNVICRANVDDFNYPECRGATMDITDQYTGAPANTKVLYRRGDTFDYSGNIVHGSNSITGAFGDCTAEGGIFDERDICSKNPLIKWVSGVGGSAIDVSYKNNVVFSDLEVDADDYTFGANSVDAGRGIQAVGAVNLLILRVHYHHYGGVNNHGSTDGIFYISSRIRYGDWHGMNYHGSRLSIVNSEFGPFGASHILYGFLVDRAVFTGSYFHDPAGAGLRFDAGTPGSRNIVISGNLFENMAAGIEVRGAHPETLDYISNILIERNFFKSSFWIAIQITYQNGHRDFIIRNNLFSLSDGASVFVSRASPPSYSGLRRGVQGLKFYGNTIFTPAIMEGVIWIETEDHQDIEIFNNIIYYTGTSFLQWAFFVNHASGMEGITSNNNLFYFPNRERDLDIFRVAGVSHDLSWWQGQGMGADSFIDNPSFIVDLPINPENFKLQSTSPAIDSGMSLPLVYDDYKGTRRPVDDPSVPNNPSAWDIGAFEFQGGAGECSVTEDCDDANACTGDICGSGICSYKNYNLDESDTIGLGDIIQIIVYWGGANPDADLDGNGNVGLSDIIVLLGVWGAYC